MFPQRHIAAISIRDPGESVTVPGFERVIMPKFHDVDREVKGYMHFSRDHALLILGFAKGLPEFITELVIHCHAGLSRSPSVAVALARIHGWTTTAHEGNPFLNKLVYTTLVNTHREISHES